jgi:hypothetical protein
MERRTCEGWSVTSQRVVAVVVVVLVLLENLVA